MNKILSEGGLGTSEERKKELMRMLAQADNFSVQINDELHVAIGTEAVEDLRELATTMLMKKGAVVTWNPNFKQWVDAEVIVDTSKEGSAQFTWDASGNRVKCNRFLVSLKDGEITKELINTCFRNFD